MRLAWVAVPVPTLDLLQYGVPDSIEMPAIGARVLVPVGTRQITGCVVRTATDYERQGPVALKNLIDVIDDDSFLPPNVVELAAWLAEYYACGTGEAIATAMPPYAWIESERAVEITEAGAALAAEPWELVHEGSDRRLTAQATALLQVLAPGKAVPVRVLAQKLAREQGMEPSEVHGLARSLARQGFVANSAVLRGRFRAFKTARVASITLAGLEACGSLPHVAVADAETHVAAGTGDGVDQDRVSAAAQTDSGKRGVRDIGSKQREALRILEGAPLGLRVAALRDRGIASDTLNRLAARGFVAFRDEQIERNPFAADATSPSPSTIVGRGFSPAETDAAARAAACKPRGGADGRVLTDEQDAALARLSALADRRAFGVALVHGVTGSGKTELYLRLAGRVVADGRSVLVMVPEIALTPALAALFRQAFGDRVAVQHSGLSDGERHDQWHRIRRGDIRVVVGTRSAVFAPLSSLGLIVVDEEHDGSYKQEESPRYHGRDVAIVRAKREGALAVLGSATPSMESYQHALSGRYDHIVLARRVLDRPLAAVSVVNMRDELATAGPDVIFSETLRAGIEERLNRNEQVLVLLNRRGFATAVFCRQCGNTIECPNCSVSLTIHGRDTRRGRCHYCNYSALVPKTCPSCAAPFLEHIGVGTERLEEEARRLFPTARVARLDRDVAARRGAITSLLGRFGAGEIDVLIGTQMIAKGHDFPRVTLVGVISADVGLGLPDFRASERTFQLLTQVVGRAGRGERPGEAVIQTLNPEHYSVRRACVQDYRAFFDEEIRFRKAMHYPPHVSLINTIVRGPSFGAAMEDAADLVGRVKAEGEGKFRVLGPAPAAFVKLRGEHRAQFFVKGTVRSAMRQAVLSALSARPDLRRRVTIDVDPLTVL